MISQDLDLFVAILLEFRRSGFRQSDKDLEWRDDKIDKQSLKRLVMFFGRPDYVRGKQVARNFLVVVGDGQL